MRYVVADDICRACGRKYHTRPRLIHHLHHGQTPCWVWHMRKFVPMTAEQTQSLDDRDREQGVALHQQGFVQLEVDKAWTKRSDIERIPALQCKINEDHP